MTPIEVIAGLFLLGLIVWPCMYIAQRLGEEKGARAERIKLYGNTLPRFENPPPPPKKEGVPKMPDHPPMPEFTKHKLRGIKFRIWDRETASWYRPVFQAYEGKLHELLLTTEGELCLRSMEGIIHESKFPFPNRYVVQVYARLKDIKGQDIYEGDIAKDRFGRIMEVQWWNYRLCWIAITDTNFHHADLLDWVARDDYGELMDKALVEVIGNRYETPELEVIGNRYETPELFTSLNTKGGK